MIFEILKLYKNYCKCFLETGNTWNWISKFEFIIFNFKHLKNVYILLK